MSSRSQRDKVVAGIEWGVVLVLLAIASINLGPVTSLMIGAVLATTVVTIFLLRRNRSRPVVTRPVQDRE